MPRWLGDILWTVRYRAKDAWWWFRHRFDPRHRYHVVPTGMRPGYYDPDIRLIAALFNETSLFVDRTRNLICWTGDEEHEAAWAAFTAAAEWWQAHKDDLGGCDDGDEEWDECKRHMHAVVENLRCMWYP